MRFVVFLLSMMLASGIARAFDCVGVTFPPTVVLCSDPELLRLTDERQEAINEARARIGEQVVVGLVGRSEALGAVIRLSLRRAAGSATTQSRITVNHRMFQTG